MGTLENSEASVPPSKRKLRERIPAVPNYSRGDDSSDEMSDNEANPPYHASQLRKNHSCNLGKNGALTAKQKYSTEYYNLNRARKIEYKKEYYAQNRERLIEKSKQYNFEHKDHFKDNRARNKEKKREWSRNYRAKNKERVKENERQYRHRNKDSINERRRKYIAENKEMVNERQRKYRAENREKLNNKVNENRKRNIEKYRGYQNAYYERNKERCRERARIFQQSKKHQAKQDGNKRSNEAGEMKIPQKVRRDSDGKLTLSMVIPRNVHILQEIPGKTMKTPVLKRCIVLLEKLNIPESSLKPLELNNLGLSQMARKPKSPKTITKKSFATERCSKLTEPLSEIQKNCILADSSERGNNLRVLIVKSDPTYLQKMFLEVEEMLAV